MYSIWSEWDIGQQDLVFTSEDVANKWLLDNDTLKECYEEGLDGQAAIDDLFSAGLIGITQLVVISE
ncbi:hypothetical protein [Salmonella phage SSBI34]|nr:hypothetical protein [Salmonella phage SSBI34]